MNLMTLTRLKEVLEGLGVKPKLKKTDKRMNKHLRRYYRRGAKRGKK